MKRKLLMLGPLLVGSLMVLLEMGAFAHPVANASLAVVGSGLALACGGVAVALGPGFLRRLAVAVRPRTTPAERTARRPR